MTVGHSVWPRPVGQPSGGGHRVSSLHRTLSQNQNGWRGRPTVPAGARPRIMLSVHWQLRGLTSPPPSPVFNSLESCVTSVWQVQLKIDSVAHFCGLAGGAYLNGPTPDLMTRLSGMYIYAPWKKKQKTWHAIKAGQKAILIARLCHLVKRVVSILSLCFLCKLSRLRRVFFSFLPSSQITQCIHWLLIPVWRLLNLSFVCTITSISAPHWFQC